MKKIFALILAMSFCVNVYAYDDENQLANINIETLLNNNEVITNDDESSGQVEPDDNNSNIELESNTEYEESLSEESPTDSLNHIGTLDTLEENNETIDTSLEAGTPQIDIEDEIKDKLQTQEDDMDYIQLEETTKESEEDSQEELPIFELVIENNSQTFDILDQKEDTAIDEYEPYIPPKNIVITIPNITPNTETDYKKDETTNNIDNTTSSEKTTTNEFESSTEQTDLESKEESNIDNTTTGTNNESTNNKTSINIQSTDSKDTSTTANKVETISNNKTPTNLVNKNIQTTNNTNTYANSDTSVDENDVGNYPLLNTLEDTEEIKKDEIQIIDLSNTKEEKSDDTCETTSKDKTIKILLWICLILIIITMSIDTVHLISVKLNDN